MSLENIADRVREHPAGERLWEHRRAVLIGLLAVVIAVSLGWTLLGFIGGGEAGDYVDEDPKYQTRAAIMDLLREDERFVFLTCEFFPAAIDEESGEQQGLDTIIILGELKQAADEIALRELLSGVDTDLKIDYRVEAMPG